MIGYVFEDGTIVWCKGLDDVELMWEKKKHGRLVKIIVEEKENE